MGKWFNPGAFRHKIRFFQPPSGKDDYGEPTDGWLPFKSAKASCEPLLGNEFYTAFTAETKIEVKFRMRYIKGITNDMRIEFGDSVYSILSAIDVNSAHKELLCYCKKVRQ